MTDEIKIGYTESDGHQSTAYVNEKAPHRGINKYTAEWVEVYFSGSLDKWMVKTSNMFICRCESCEETFDKKMLKHGNITQVNEF